MIHIKLVLIKDQFKSVDYGGAPLFNQYGCNYSGDPRLGFKHLVIGFDKFLCTRYVVWMTHRQYKYHFGRASQTIQWDLDYHHGCLLSNQQAWAAYIVTE